MQSLTLLYPGSELHHVIKDARAAVFGKVKFDARRHECRERALERQPAFPFNVKCDLAPRPFREPDGGALEE